MLWLNSQALNVGVYQNLNTPPLQKLKQSLRIRMVLALANALATARARLRRNMRANCVLWRHQWRASCARGGRPLCLRESLSFSAPHPPLCFLLWTIGDGWEADLVTGGWSAKSGQGISSSRNGRRMRIRSWSDRSYTSIAPRTRWVPQVAKVSDLEYRCTVCLWGSTGVKEALPACLHNSPLLSLIHRDCEMFRFVFKVKVNWILVGCNSPVFSPLTQIVKHTSLVLISVAGINITSKTIFLFFF